MARHIDAVDCADKISEKFNIPLGDLVDVFAEIPTADVVEVKTIKAWLYEMAINNVGYAFDGDFSVACEEIISRLDGLRNFARDSTLKERGGEK